MGNGLLAVAGGALAVAGTIWALQGFGVIGGSFMSGDSVWAAVGPVVAAAGLILLVIGIRRARASG